MAHFDRFHGGRWATIAVFRRQGPAALQSLTKGKQRLERQDRYNPMKDKLLETFLIRV